MKKLFTLLMLFPFLLTAQIYVDNNWKNSINPTFQNLDKTKVQSGILLDYAMEFTDVTAYNGILTDTTSVDFALDSFFVNVTFITILMVRASPI